MTQAVHAFDSERIMETMIDLTGLSTSYRVIVAGRDAFDVYLGLLHRGFSRVTTTAACRIPCGQHDVALIVGQHSAQAREALLVRIVPFLNARSTMAVWIDSEQHQGGKAIQLLLERLGFRIEAGAKCEKGYVLSAHRRETNHMAKAA